MRKCSLAVVLAALSLGGLVHAQVANPINCDVRCTLTPRYMFPNGFQSLGLNPQDLARVVFGEGESLPGNDYDFYLRATHHESAGERVRFDVAVADAVFPVAYANPSGPAVIGPFRFGTTCATDCFDLWGDAAAMIDWFTIVPAGEPLPEQYKPTAGLAVEKWSTLLLDWPEKHLHPIWVTAEMPVEIRVRGGASEGVNGEAKVHCIILDYEHEQVGQYDFTFPLGGDAPRQRMEVIPVPARFGPYLLRFLVTMPDGAQRDYQRMVSRVASPLEPPVNDLVGGHGNLPLLRWMGAKWNRKWDIGGGELFWRTVQPEENGPFQFDYEPLDAPLAELVVLERAPDWAIGRDDYDQLWLAYVRAVAEHYRGRIKAYEIYNEPYDQPTDEFVARHVKRVAETAKVIREADPNATILAGGPPEEIPPGLKWWEKMAKAGFCKPLDVISAHLYFGGGGTHPLDMDLRFDEYVQGLRTILDEHGGAGKMLWDTESGLCPMESFYIGGTMPYGLWSGKGFVKRTPVSYQLGTAMAARYLMLHLHYNIRWNYYHSGTAYGNSWALTDWEETPLPAAVAMAQVNRLLTGASPDGRPELPEGLWGLRFKKGDRTIAGVWAIRLKLGESRFIQPPKDQSIQLMDLFCNPLTTEGQLQIGSSPLLLTGTREAIDAYLASLSVRVEQDDVLAPDKVQTRLTATDYKDQAELAADSTAEGATLDAVRDGKTDGAAWASAPAKGEHWIEYRWPQPQTINRLICAWPTDALPDRYKAKWFDGAKWRPCSGTPDWRSPGLPLEDYTITEVKTRQLRMIIACDNDRGAKVTEFSAFHVPRLTPPITEMQEIWSKDFTPDEQGFIRDWLVCGPFPSPGLRWAIDKTPANWDSDFLDVCWIYGHGRGEPVIQPRVDQEHFAFFPSVPEPKWNPVDVRVAWQPLHADDARVDLTKHFTSPLLVEQGSIVEQCIGYAAAYIVVPQDMDVTLSIGSDDGYRLWIDENLVAENVAFRQAERDQEQYPVQLSKGQHRLLVKIHNDIGGHELFLRLLDKEGQPVTGYTVRLLP